MKMSATWTKPPKMKVNSESGYTLTNAFKDLCSILNSSYIERDCFKSFKKDISDLKQSVQKYINLTKAGNARKQLSRKGLVKKTDSYHYIKPSRQLREKYNHMISALEKPSFQKPVMLKTTKPKPKPKPKSRDKPRGSKRGGPPEGEPPGKRKKKVNKANSFTTFQGVILFTVIKTMQQYCAVFFYCI